MKNCSVKEKKMYIQEKDLKLNKVQFTRDYTG